MKSTDVFKKLRIDRSQKILIVNAPKEFIKTLGKLTYDTRPKTGKVYDFIQIFATKQNDLEKLIKKHASAGKYDCIVWACYPKGTGSIPSDMKRETVWHALSLGGLRPVSQIAIDETWSALRGRPV
ncbi:hypothetical protein HUU42_11995 [bacterium]|nr:hypothetical protein [bacterium]